MLDVLPPRSWAGAVRPYARGLVRCRQRTIAGRFIAEATTTSYDARDQGSARAQSPRSRRRTHERDRGAEIRTRRVGTSSRSPRVRRQVDGGGFGFTTASDGGRVRSCLALHEEASASPTPAHASPPRKRISEQGDGGGRARLAIARPRKRWSGSTSRGPGRARREGRGRCADRRRPLPRNQGGRPAPVSKPRSRRGERFIAPMRARQRTAVAIGAPTGRKRRSAPDALSSGCPSGVVPEQARRSAVDRLFSARQRQPRRGVTSWSRGRTAEILAQATKRSFVILDEGSGTSTTTGSRGGRCSGGPRAEPCR